MKKYGLKFVEEYPSWLRAQLFKDYFKFLFVREPMDRLLSAYRDKLESTYAGIYNPYKEWNLHKYGTVILQRYRKNVAPRILRTGRTSTFSEFLRFLKDEMNYNKGIDNHWKLYEKILNPCGMDFDFVGKKETWDEDLETILPKLFPRGTKKSVFPKSNVTPGGKVKPQKYFDSVDPHLIRLIAEKFKSDFQLYGYDPDKYL